MQNISNEHGNSPDEQLEQIKRRLIRILTVMAEVPVTDDVPMPTQPDVALSLRAYQTALA